MSERDSQADFASRPTCSSCRHFSALDTQCRRNAPTAFMASGPRGIAFLGTWPPTKESDWCGQWESHLTVSGVLQ